MKREKDPTGRIQKTLTAKKKKKKEKEKKAIFKRKYQESHLNYRFIARSDSHSSSLLCKIHGNWLSNEAMKASKLLCHMETSTLY